MNDLQNIGNVFDQQESPPNWSHQYENALGRQRADFKKLAPSYICINMIWDPYMNLFTTEKSDYSLLTDDDFKKILYSKPTDEASKITSPDFLPLKPYFQPLTLHHSAKKLGNLFELGGQVKLIFEQKIQLQGEPPTDYPQNKLGSLHHTNKKFQRDYQFIYIKMILGLLNQDVRTCLCFQTPEPVENFKLLRESMMKIASVVQYKHLKGEMEEAEAKSSQFLSAVQTVKTNIPRSEVVNTLIGQKLKGYCHFHKNKEHNIAQCPRKATELLTVAPSFGDKIEVSAVVSKNMYQEVRNTMSTSLPSNKSRNNHQHMSQQKGRTGKIMFVYEDTEGELQCEPVEEQERSEYTLEEKEDKTEDTVNKVEDTRDHSEGDYISGSF